MKYDEPNLLVVLGPTASGKTRLAVQLAYQLQSGVISADSRQVYRHMDIGTGKDLNEYILDNQQIPYHLIDILEPGDQYDVAQFQRDVLQIIPQYTPPNIPVLCGGTGLYIQAILANHQFTQIPIDEEKRTFWQKAGFEAAQKHYENLKEWPYQGDTSTFKRLIRAIEINEYLLESPMPDVSSYAFSPFIIGLDVSREERRKRISARLKKRVEQEGMIQEVEGLLKKGVSADKLRFYGLEYKYITDYLEGYLTRETMLGQLEVAIHQFAKRQMTFFRSMEKKGMKIHWIDAQLDVTQQLNEIKKAGFLGLR